MNDPANDPSSIADLGRAEQVRLLLDLFHRNLIHHALWFAEVRHQMGEEMALEAMDEVLGKGLDLQLKRLAKVLGVSLEDGLPEPLLEMPDETRRALIEAASANWLATDGLWFQAVEFRHGMNEAKRCNDSCWAHFSPFEAWSIKRFLKLPDRPGLQGLKTALNFRLYSSLNEQSMEDDTPHSFIFRMNRCRVQTARNRKGLADYPCKSGGLVEYTYFARAIDSRIRTECLACPPDPHPEEWVCAWRFSLPEPEGRS
ncbi:MAG: cytosolic protein [Deltaproteobacteria bacterium]|nr:cytosolic protein [Deltaproteobacteria bacterium]